MNFLHAVLEAKEKVTKSENATKINKNNRKG